MNRFAPRLLAGLFTVFALGSLIAGQALAAGGNLAAVRAATAQFNSTAQADAAGYGPFPAGVPLHECISNLSGPGAMGFHWVNGAYIDGVADPLHPEVLVYAPDSHGKLKLVALEYVIFQADWYANHPQGSMPELFGQMFMATGSPNRYDIPAFFALHVWLYDSNPAGMFANFNPTVSCDGAAAAATSRTAASVDAAARLAVAPAGRFACRLESTGA
ncbi:MAG TPA: hypothetical protein VFJ71_03425 [Candidatus Limnocylindrales bacterium]|nr:hypothetical protein [Candidatus Limnocylindrales bacterium]